MKLIFVILFCLASNFSLAQQQAKPEDETPAFNGAESWVIEQALPEKDPPVKGKENEYRKPAQGYIEPETPSKK